jgi:hypothetical protein
VRPMTADQRAQAIEWMASNRITVLAYALQPGSVAGRSESSPASCDIVCGERQDARYGDVFHGGFGTPLYVRVSMLRDFFHSTKWR